MRQTASVLDAPFIEERGYYPNYELVPYRESMSTSESATLLRSDVQKGQFDPLRWRPPTNYTADYFLADDWKGYRERRGYFAGQLQEVNRLSGVLNANGNLGLYRRSIPDDLLNFPSALTDQAIVSCLLKARDQKVNLAVTLAEAPKAVALISERVSQLYRSYHQFRRGNLKAAVSILGVGGVKSKKNAKTWLELQYGWMPLLQDIHGTYEEVTRQARTNGLLFKVTSTKSNKVDSILDYSDTGRQEILTVKGVHSAKVCLWYTVTYESLQAASRVGLTNPLEIAWELTPWSFVVDWLIPVGDLLGTLTATSGLTFKSGTSTRYTKIDMIGTAKFLGYSQGYWEYNQKGEATCAIQRMKMQRTVLHSSPIPGFYIKNPFSVSHGLNALALLRSLF